MPDLNKALEESRPAIEAGLAEAERELAELNRRRQELEALLARARLILGDVASPSPEAVRKRLTLHEAMEQVLRDRGNSWTTVHDLAADVNARRLYEKRDGSPVDPSQIHARANKYPTWFEKDGSRVRLVES